LDAGGLASQIAEEVETSAADLAFANHFDGADRWGMQGEDAFDAYAEADATHGESGAGSAALLRDDHTFKSLETFFFLLAFTFLEADVHADGVARAEFGEVFAQLRFMQFTNCRVHVRASFRPTGGGASFSKANQNYSQVFA